LLPVAPTSVDVDAGLFNVTLVPNSSRAGQLYEFYRSSVALTSETITANANFLGRSTTLADNNLEFNTTYFYYIRGFNAYGVSAFYPVQVTTDNSPAKYIDVLTGEIRESHLYQSLNEEIEKISGPESLVDSVAYKVAQAKAETETFIVTVENTLKDADTALAERIDVLSANFDDNTAIIQSEQQARADADDALAQQINSV
jgi:predicted phage tail protein